MASSTLQTQHCVMWHMLASSTVVINGTACFVYSIAVFATLLDSAPVCTLHAMHSSSMHAGPTDRALTLLSAPLPCRTPWLTSRRRRRSCCLCWTRCWTVIPRCSWGCSSMLHRPVHPPSKLCGLKAVVTWPSCYYTTSKASMEVCGCRKSNQQANTAVISLVICGTSKWPAWCKQGSSSSQHARVWLTGRSWWVN